MLNIFSVIGRFTANPELKTTQNGKSVCSFTLANDTGYDEYKQTNWLDCVAWNSKAEAISKYFTKGSRIAITGQVTTRQYEDKEGKKRKVTEIKVIDFDFIDKKSEQADPLQKVADNVKKFGVNDGDFTEIDGDDDLPF